MISSNSKSRLEWCSTRLTDIRLGLVQAACGPAATADDLREAISVTCDGIETVIEALRIAIREDPSEARW